MREEIGGPAWFGGGGISDVIQDVADVREVCGGRSTAEDFYGVVRDPLSGSSGGSSYAE